MAERSVEQVAGERSARARNAWRTRRFGSPVTALKLTGIAILLVLAAPGAAVAQGGTASISGTILDANGDVPPNASAGLCPGETALPPGCPGFQFIGANQATGEYTISGLDAGTYRVVGIANAGQAFVGSGSDAVVLTLADGEQVSGVDFVFDARIVGRITDPNGDPVEGARIIFEQGGRVGIGGEVTTTNANGEYETPFLGDGSYTVKVLGGGTPATLAGRGTVSVAAGAVATLDLQLGPAATISGTILDANGDAPPGAFAGLCPGETGPGPPNCPGFQPIGASPATGQYVIEGLAPGAYRVSGIAKAGDAFVGAGTPQTLTLAGGEHVSGVDFVFDARIAGRITDPNGDPLDGARILFEGGVGGRVTTTNANGEYLTPYLGGGTYKVKVLAGGSPATLVGRDTVTVAAGATATLDLQLSPPAEINGTTLGDGGAVLPGSGAAICPVPVINPPFCEGLEFSFVDGNGNFVLREIVAGTYTVGGFQLGDPLLLTPSVVVELAPGDVVTCAFTLGSSPSATCSGASGDGDGIDNGTEDGAPNGGDGNNDGIPDSQQGNVASLPGALDFDGNGSLDDYLTLASPPGTRLLDVSVVDPATLPVPPPPGAQLPLGAISFTVEVANPGDGADVSLFMPAGTGVDSYLKFHDGAWAVFPDIAVTGNVLVLTLVDGGAGDDDDTANRLIVDPGAPADVFDFAGFFRPIDAGGTLNRAKAGSAIPVKFSLGGDQGLDILAEGYPRSHRIDCTTSADVDGIEETVTAGASGLSYDAVQDQYVYTWKTSKDWASQETPCRRLVVKLSDGTVHKADFKFF